MKALGGTGGSGGRRFLGLVVGMLAVAAVFVPVGGARPATTVYPTLYVEYTLGCTFTIVDDSGKPVTQIPPGTYQVEVQTPLQFKLVDTTNLQPNDYTGCKGWVQFQLTGPGVNLATTLDTGCDSNYLLPSTLFKPNATYTATDLNQPTVAHATFTTLATGTPTIPQTPYNTNGTGKGQSSTDLVGSAIKTPIRGTITTTLNQHGTPTLTTNGKPLTTLKAGRYTFKITDTDAKASLTLQQATQPTPKTLTTTTFTGKHTVTLTLTTGRWLYYSGLGTAHPFTVT